MAHTYSQLSMKFGESSTIESPAWETSGISTGFQVLNQTAGSQYWAGGQATAIGSSDEYLYTIEFAVDDVSDLLLNDEQFRESINRGRNQMRLGGPYLSHDDVFGE